jgi:anti-anti-sigma factor
MALVEISQTQGRVPVTIFTLTERIQLGNFSILENTAKEAFDNGTRNLVIDLSKTDSMTSIGVRALVVIHKMLAKDNGRLKVSGATTMIREMLGVTGITQFIGVYDTIQEATASF